MKNHHLVIYENLRNQSQQFTGYYSICLLVNYIGLSQSPAFPPLLMMDLSHMALISIIEISRLLVSHCQLVINNIWLSRGDVKTSASWPCFC